MRYRLVEHFLAKLFFEEILDKLQALSAHHLEDGVLLYILVGARHNVESHVSYGIGPICLIFDDMGPVP